MMRTPEHIPSAVHAPHRSPRGVHDVRLRHVVGAIFLATMAVLAGALYTVARTMLHAGFGEVERRETIRNIERARGALEQTLASMSSKVSDWAAWDDTCRFIVDGNQAYIDSNLTPASLANLNIESILFFDVDGRLVNATVIDAHTSDSSDLPAGLVDALTAAGLHHHEDESSALTRILLVDNTPYLIASRPIITSENTGPVRGATVFVRRLSEELIAEFAQRTHVDVGIYPLTAPDVPPDCLAAVPSLHSESNFVSPLDHHRIAGYTMLFDANGAPGLVLRIHTGRDVYQQGLASMRWIIAALILVGIGVGACTLVLIDRLVISRLVRMSAMVERIGEGDDNVILP